MARKKKHEEHLNHEAWAIPYGDLITLLLAFFVVMYSMSSVNEGKYRILSDSLVAAFRGAPTTLAPIPVGKQSMGKGGDAQLQGSTPTMLLKLPDPRPVVADISNEVKKGGGVVENAGGRKPPPLTQMQEEVQKAMQTLIDKKLVVVRRSKMTLEVEIRTDILFASGVATVSPAAVPVLQELSAILKPFSNAVRVEGHTDNRPINTREFPSNWELSAARAASVVHLFMQQGIDPARLEIIGLGEYRPVGDNATAEGRNTNRRVVVVIMEGSGDSKEEDAGTAAPAPAGAAQSPGSGAGSGTPGAAAPNAERGRTVLAEPKK